MRHRVFIAINLPNNIKEKIRVEIEELRPYFKLVPIRFLPPENWHITVSFLGYQDDVALDIIMKVIERVVRRSELITIKFERLLYGPINKSPRMIWLVGDKSTSDKLGKLKILLENELAASGINFRQENRSFTAHITLARLAEISGKLPSIEKNVTLTFLTETLDLMESTLRSSGAEYEIMAKFKLNG